MENSTPASALRITLVQTDLAWHQPQENREHFARIFERLQGQTDILLLPEMFTSGFTTEVDGLDDTGAPTGDWMLAQAAKTDAAVCGSTVFKSEAGFSNRMLFASPDGQLAHYDKVHLFRMLGEHKRYIQGERRVVIDYKGWKILLLVCYDLRFPVFCRNRQDYDLILCVANWPEARRQAWVSLLQARAIENQAFVAAVNRVGTDGKGLQYSGDSIVLDYLGSPLLSTEPHQEFIETVAIEYKDLIEFRESHQFWRDADEFELGLGPD